MRRKKATKKVPPIRAFWEKWQRLHLPKDVTLEFLAWASKHKPLDTWDDVLMLNAWEAWKAGKEAGVEQEQHARWVEEAS